MTFTMCFSATASFGVAAALLPVGAYCVHRARRENRAWIAFAAFPLAFALQQAVEGAVWIGITSGNELFTLTAARGYLFFSHAFWLFWVPYSVLRLETGAHRKRLLSGLTALGGLYGASLFLPALVNGDWLDVEVVQNSLVYNITLLYDDYVLRDILRIIYIAIIVGALLACSIAHVRVFGVLIFVSVIAAYAYFNYAFTSVWCFFAAVLSLYVLYIVIRDLRPKTAQVPS